VEFHLIAKREWTSKYRGVVTKPSQSAVSKPSSLDKARNTREQHQTSNITPPDVNQEKDKELPSPEEILLTLLVQVDSCSPADLLALTTILPHDSDERKNFDRQETFILGDPAASFNRPSGHTYECRYHDPHQGFPVWKKIFAHIL